MVVNRGTEMERVSIDSRQVTDSWFDDEHPNPLHPIGTKDRPIIIDPIKRVVEFPTDKGVFIAGVGDTIVTTTLILHRLWK